MGRKKREFNRLRLDSGQHRRIMLVSALLGALAFLPVGLRLYNLMVTNYDYYSPRSAVTVVVRVWLRRAREE